MIGVLFFGTSPTGWNALVSGIGLGFSPDMEGQPKKGL